jgi:hypothetical protein
VACGLKDLRRPAEILAGVSPNQHSATLEAPLWLTVPGARLGVPLGWLGWMVSVALLAPAVVDRLGAAGAALGVMGLGWLLAARLPSPLEWLRRYHLDDVELTAMGPGATVRRLPWARVHTLTQERRSLRVAGDGQAFRVPLAPIVRHEAWASVLAHVIPELADELWALLEEGEQVRLAPPLDPPTRALGWWAYAPALVAVVTAAGTIGVLVALALAAGERALALVRVRTGAVTIHRAGVALRTWAHRVFASWPRAEVVQGPEGLVVGVADGASGRVPTALPNFWAAAAVIQLKAQLGLRAGASVHFRVRMGDDGFAVVGEIEPGADA